MLKVTDYGQVFTPVHLVDAMLALRRNKGNTLEPSCGDGAFSSRIPGCLALELDPDVAWSNAINTDFFEYAFTGLFDTIIGNPPYVRYQDILTSTKNRLDMTGFDNRSNLYLFFIKRCIELLNPSGELIFIVPREFLKATSARHLNEFIYAEGTITDIFETGDTPGFKNATPNCVVFRFERGNFTRKTNGTLLFSCHNGQLYFTEKPLVRPFSDLFEVKVGAVSGMDRIFRGAGANAEFVYSATASTGETIRMWFGLPAKEALASHKTELLARKIRAYTEQNWWEWGRLHHQTDRPRIYVNAKTRASKPFFLHPCNNYDGSVLALFPKEADPNLPALCEYLNSIDWNALGFRCDGRYLFSQRSLETAWMPA